jgi:hypothetical protein
MQERARTGDRKIDLDSGLVTRWLEAARVRRYKQLADSLRLSSLSQQGDSQFSVLLSKGLQRLAMQLINLSVKFLRAWGVRRRLRCEGRNRTETLTSVSYTTMSFGARAPASLARASLRV